MTVSFENGKIVSLLSVILSPHLICMESLKYVIGQFEFKLRYLFLEAESQNFAERQLWSLIF